MPEKEILIIDDEQMILDMLDQILSSAGYRVHAALGGHKALELYDQHPVDLVLTDIKMPGVDGYHLLKEIKSRNANVRIVLMSGYSNDFSIREAIELGADEFIVKPFRRNEILQVLQAAME
jgi:YesN/AraC family two-component response regulator